MDIERTGIRRASIRAFILAMVALSVTMVSARGQSVQEPSGGARTMRFNANSVVFIRELGAIVALEQKALVVKMVAPKEGRSKEAADVDLQVNDEVGMANGKRVTTIKEFRTLYEETPVGSEFKMGVRREGRAVIISFKKKEVKEMPGGMRIMTAGGEGVYPAVGIQLEQKGSSVAIARTFPNVPEGLKEGDVIVSLNGKKVATVKDFEKEFENTPVGGNLEFKLMRDGKDATFSMKRPEPGARIRVRSE